MSGPLPGVLDTAAVMARYGLRDPRAARRVMDQAGAFLVGRRLVVRVDRLEAWEVAQEEARRAPPPQVRAPRPRRATRPRPREPLRPGFWREEGA